MPPTARHIGPHSSRLVYALFSLISGGLSHLRGTVGQFPEGVHRHVKRAPTTEQVERILFPILIPVLVLLSVTILSFSWGTV
ncbi:hypothetical protein BDP27DRAFT_1323148 [Rhodocollybia butyracea]|uniref:Uncharacterized protein n=1 Tax=Rhodocollybia butyracea TaxID=206335 RepID=A0A9P5U9E0_9AGAR|nr:hypothetical protein BDP27DRAFT_1323148 [Rhodocollybia butyracea]